MKHPLSTTAILIFLFVATQVIGLSLLSMDIKDISKDAQGNINVTHNPTAIGERPQTSGAGSLIYIAIGVAIGTALMMLIIRFKLFSFWKGWFFFAVWLSTSVAFGVMMPSIIAFIICFALAIWKVFFPNPYIHNLVEIFMYAGIAIIIVPIFTLWWAIALLAVISAYDIIAVWYSKHMVTMAESQKEQKLFAGLYIPKKDQQAQPLPATKTSSPAKTSSSSITPSSSSKSMPDKVQAKPKKDSHGSSAILGGGDLAFPLIFSGVVMEWLISNGVGKTTALYETLVMTACVTLSLALLFVFAKKDRYYPAMPFLSAGCIVGFAIVWLIQLI